MILARIKFIPKTYFIRNYQVAVLGAANEIGQTISLLLRAQPSITKLVIQDSLQETPGVLMDVSHVPSRSALIGYFGEDTYEKALKNSDLVIASGGTLLKPGLSKQSCFSENTNFIKKAAAAIAKATPMPIVGIVTEPINSIVPMAAEVMRNNGDYDEKKLFGITTIDTLRAQCFYASEFRLNPCDCFVPVIGGRSSKTTVPLFSQATPNIDMNEIKVQELTAKIRKANDIIATAKRGWSPTLSIAFSALVFVRNIINALDGHPSKVNAFVENNDFGTSFFSGLVSVTQNGAGDMDRYNNLSRYECQLLESSINQLRKDITKGRKVLEMA